MDGGGVDRPPYAAAVRFYLIAEVHWPTLDFTFKEVDLLTQSPARFCNLIEGWARDLIVNRSKPEEVETNIAQWEFHMVEPLTWQSEREATATTLQAERDAFLALDQIETH